MAKIYWCRRNYENGMSEVAAVKAESVGAAYEMHARSERARQYYFHTNPRAGQKPPPRCTGIYMIPEPPALRSRDPELAQMLDSWVDET
jgi:hypothetical protein